MFLNDREIQQLIDDGSIAGGPPKLEDPFHRDSPAQPSSLDIHAGAIYRPDEAEGQSLRSDTLKPGHTVIVETAESFAFPSEIGGFAFPPTGISSRGVLMADPGHIDPGYKGTLRFTLVNIGGEPFALDQRTTIGSLLLFRLNEKPTMDWSERRGSDVPEARERIAETLPQLSGDFLQIDERARTVAREETQRNRARDVWRPILLFGLPFLIAAVVAFMSLSIEVEKLEERINVGDLKTRLERLETTSQIEGPTAERSDSEPVSTPSLTPEATSSP